MCVLKIFASMTFGTISVQGWFKGEADLYSVAGLAGHKNIKTTQRYAHLSPEKLRSTIQMLNVGDNG